MIHLCWGIQRWAHLPIILSDGIRSGPFAAPILRRREALRGLQTLRSDRHYQRLDISGMTEAQRAAPHRVAHRNGGR